MKKLILLFIYIVSLNPSFGQWNPFSNPIRLTNGNNDRNASFRSSVKNFDFGANYDWEFLVFERVTGLWSQICISKIDYVGPLDSATYVTNDSYINKNPSISYSSYYYFIGRTVKYALVAWESNKFGRQSIFGSKYIRETGWSIPFIIDSSGLNSITPRVLSLDSINYLITYQSGSDIKYKKFNLITNSFLFEKNLTFNDSNFCSNPQIASFRDQFNNNKVAVSFEKEISTTQRAIFFRTGYADSIPLVGSSSDTIAYTGININEGFNFFDRVYNVFSSNRQGNYNIYATAFSNTSSIQNSIIINQQFDNYNYVGINPPITDLSAITHYIYAYNRKSPFEIKLIVRMYNFNSDSLIVEISRNPGYITKNSLSPAVPLPNHPLNKYWFVFNKDSLSINHPSRIYGVYFVNSLSNINGVSSINVNTFILHQNYPNPFNPKTIINYDISFANKGLQPLVLLKIYDVNGKEVTTLVDAKQSATGGAGSYSVEWDASNYPSGIYFYRLTAGDYSEIKKMILIK